MNQYNKKFIVCNKRIHHKYFIEKTIESGIVLFGWEVKSVRLKLITIDNSYISFKGHEAYIYNSVFQTQLKNNNISNYNSVRARKLLLKKKELLFLKEYSTKLGYTIAVINLFWKNSWIKINIGIAKGKKKYDKRYIINKNSWNKEKIKVIKNINK